VAHDRESASATWWELIVHHGIIDIRKIVAGRILGVIVEFPVSSVSLWDFHLPGGTADDTESESGIACLY